MMIDAIEDNWKSLFGESMPFDEQEQTTSPSEMITQTQINQTICPGRFCSFSNLGKVVKLTELNARLTGNQDMHISISSGVLGMLAITCIIAMTVCLFKFVSHRINRKNRITPHEMELGQLPTVEEELDQLPAVQKPDVDQKRDLPAVSAKVEIIEVKEAKPSKVVTTLEELRDDIGGTHRPLITAISGRRISRSCPGFYTDFSSSLDTLND